MLKNEQTGEVTLTSDEFELILDALRPFATAYIRQLGYSQAAGEDGESGMLVEDDHPVVTGNIDGDEVQLFALSAEMDDNADELLAMGHLANARQVYEQFLN